MNEVAEVLIQARDLLASGRWCKGTPHDGHGNYCTAGAIGRVSGLRLAIRHLAYQELVNHVPQRRGVVSFNDAPETTLADVVALFDKTLANMGALHEAT